jgi:mannosyltransferase OCH1-like enzyme
LFHDAECRAFISREFPDDVLYAYDHLIPTAFKADLWRYCVLYKRGGIYLDIKYCNVGDFKLISLTDREYFVRDIPSSGEGIYNAFMICLPGNHTLKKGIDRIVENVQNRFYGTSFLEPTGPSLLANFFSKEEKNNFDMKHVLYGTNEYEKVVQFNGKNVFNCYPGYFQERQKSSTKKHYSDLWNERNIYL